MKQILIYTPIYSFLAEEFINKMAEVEESEPVTLRVNSPGGSVFAGWGMIRSMMEHKGEINYKVDGVAASMAFYMMLFADKREGLDVSRFLIHRADGYVSNEAEQKELNDINALIRSQMEKVVDSDKFKEVTGVSIDEIFAQDKRIDVWLSAKQAKKLGLINKIVRLEPKEIEALTNIAASNEKFFTDEPPRGSEGTAQGSAEGDKNKNTNINQNVKKMTVEEIRAQHPESYAQIQNDAIKAEQIRVKSWLAYLAVDPEEVTVAIKEGKEFTTAVISEMAVKMHAAATKANLEKDAAGKTDTQEPDEKTAEQKEIEAFEAEVKAGLKLNK